MPTAEAPLSSQADAQAGRGMVTGRGKLLKLRHCWLLLLPTPVPFQHSLATQLAWVRAKVQEQWKGGEWEQSTKGRGPRPKGGGEWPSPQQLPTEFTAQKTPLVHQLHVEVY